MVHTSLKRKDIDDINSFSLFSLAFHVLIKLIKMKFFSLSCCCCSQDLVLSIEYLREHFTLHEFQLDGTSSSSNEVV